MPSPHAQGAEVQCMQFSSVHASNDVFLELQVTQAFFPGRFLAGCIFGVAILLRLGCGRHVVRGHCGGGRSRSCLSCWGCWGCRSWCHGRLLGLNLNCGEGQQQASQDGKVLFHGQDPQFLPAHRVSASGSGWRKKLMSLSFQPARALAGGIEAVDQSGSRIRRFLAKADRARSG